MKTNKKLPRGLRNNNPGNIRISDRNNWKGKVPRSKNTDGAFEQFQFFDGFAGMVWGARALTILANNYVRQNSGHTIMTFFNKYAPQVENNTMAYAQFVAKKLGVGIDAKVKPILEDNKKQYLFLLAIIQHENGIAFDHADIAKGVELGNS